MDIGKDKVIASTEVQKYRSTEVQKYRSLSTSIYFGNIYGLHDGYDGSVFSPYGLCKTITASVGGIACILVKDDDN